MYAKYAKLTKIDNKPKIFKICTQKTLKNTPNCQNVQFMQNMTIWEFRQNSAFKQIQIGLSLVMDIMQIGQISISDALAVWCKWIGRMALGWISGYPADLKLLFSFPRYGRLKLEFVLEHISQCRIWALLKGHN